MSPISTASSQALRGRTIAACIAATSIVSLTAPAAHAAKVTTGIAPTVIINEVSTTNLTGATDEKSKRGDWIELYNTTGAAVDLSGWGLSNTAKSPFRWVFPAGTKISAKSYLRIWADKADRTTSTSNLHTNFNIDNGADAAVLAAPNATTLGQIVDQVTPPLTAPDVSLGRFPSGDPSANWTNFLSPTPGSANSGTTATGLLSAPKLSVASGVYPAAQTVTVTAGTSAVDQGAELRYTLDGSVPTIKSPLVSGPIAITKSTTLRVGAFKDGAISSYVATGNYIVEASTKYAGQRLLFIAMAPSDARSWFAGGSAPSSGWRSAVQMITPEGKLAFSGDSMTEQAGQLGSRNGQQTLPLEINFKDATGTKTVDYPIFSDKPGTTSYKKLRLRNAGDDYQEAHLRDQYWQALGAEANLVPAAYEPTQVFVNGAYYGMMDLREKEDETLIESTFGVDKDTVEYRSDSRVVAGENTAASFSSMSSFIRNTDLSVPANYEKAASMLDVENFAHDFALHMFGADRDWQWRNMHAFRMPGYDGKWRYRGHDYDISSDGTDAWGYNTDTDVNMNDKYTGHESGSIMRALLKNSQFKALYANIIADQLNTFASPAESQALLDRMAAKLEPYMANHVAKNGQPKTVDAWRGEVARLRTFLSARANFYIPNTRSYLGLGELAPITVGVDDAARGTVKVNTIDLSTRMKGAGATWTGKYWTGTPVTITAKPKVGFVFAGWSDGETSATRSVQPGDAATYSATFAATAAVAAPVLSAPAPASAVLVTGKVVSLPIVASDPTGLKLTYSAKALPNGIDIHPVTGLISGKPTRAGSFASTITVNNGKVKTSVAVTFTVTNALDRLITLPSMITGDGQGLTAVWSKDAANGGTGAVTQIAAPTINMGAGVGPFSGWSTSGWSVKFTGMVTAPKTGQYAFKAAINSDDGARLSIGGTSVFDAWTSRATAPTGAVDLVAGKPTPISIEFVDKSGSANLSLSWLVPGATAYETIDRGVLDPK